MNQASEDQIVRVALRARFLNLISRLAGKNEYKNPIEPFKSVFYLGKECKLEMYEQATVSCEIAACDSAFENIMVSNLKTPAKSVLDKAILRSGDIISMHFIVDDICRLSSE